MLETVGVRRHPRLAPILVRNDFLPCYSPELPCHIAAEWLEQDLKKKNIGENVS